MASTLTVDNIVGATSSSTIHIPGHVIQVVNSTYNTTITQSSVAGAIETGLAATITPKFSTSTILILANQNIQTSGSGYGQICLRQGTIASNTLLSIITSPEGYNNSTYEEINTVSICYEHSPATTSATRYFCSMELLAGGPIYAQTATSGNSVSSMTLLEIAQ